jgi:hypothetical protein
LELWSGFGKAIDDLGGVAVEQMVHSFGLDLAYMEKEPFSKKTILKIKEKDLGSD